MRRGLARWFLTALLGGVAAAVSLVFLSERRGLVLDVYLLFLGATALRALVRVTTEAHRRRARSDYEDALRRPAGKHDPRPQLARLEGQVALATESAFYLHRLRPLLQEIAAHRLGARHGIRLEDERRARAALGDEAWQLLRPGRQLEGDPLGPGLSARELGEVVGALERI